MKAIRIHAYGGREQLCFEEAPKPLPGVHDVLVRVIAASVNPVDWKIRAGYLKDMLPLELPFIPGWDLSGVVDSIGTRVTKFKPGDLVFSRPSITRDGSFAEFIAVNQDELAIKPATLCHAGAAALPLAGITAWDALVKIAQIKAGDRVLIHAAAGGVGSLAVQLAKNFGAYVIATASEKNSALVKSLGADEVIDYRQQPFEKIINNLDIVFDTLGGETQEKSWQTLREGGILVSVVEPPAAEKASAHKVRSAFLFIQPDAQVLAELARLVDAGKLRPIVSAEFSLENAAKVHELSESGRTVGKIVVHIGQP